MKNRRLMRGKGGMEEFRMSLGCVSGASAGNVFGDLYRSGSQEEKRMKEREGEDYENSQLTGVE